MKRFAFSLQRMLSFKQTMYEKERNTLAQLRAERSALEQRRDDTIAQMLHKDALFRAKAASGGVSAEEVRQLSFHRDNSDKLVQQFNIEIAQINVRIEEQLKIVVALDKEVKSLEKLKEKQWEEYQQELAKEERERILELVSAKFAETQKAEQAQEDQQRALEKAGA